MAPFPPQRDHERPEGVRLIDITDASRRKNVPALLRAFAIVRQQRPDAVLTLIGGGLSEDGELAATARDQGLDQGVHFVGPVGRDVVASELARATALVHSSREESQGLCLLEGLAWGLPVIAGRDSGGCAWTLGDGAAGTLVDVTRPEAMAQAAIRAAEDAHFDPEPGWQLLESRYSPDVVADAYERVYERVTRGG